MHSMLIKCISLVSKLKSTPSAGGVLASNMRVMRHLCLAGVAVWAGEYLQLAAYTCVALLCSHVAALATIQVSHASLDALTLASGYIVASSGSVITIVGCQCSHAQAECGCTLGYCQMLVLL